MQIRIQPWTVKEVIDNIDDFNLNPKYQRLPVWKLSRKALLIDSILRGYDLPKFYVKLYAGARNRWEVTDGQQRINAIVDFCNDRFRLEPKTIIDTVDLSGLLFSDLPKKYRKLFLEFELTFSEILKSADGEVNELFARLQKGVPLSEVELRHAMFSNFGFAVDELLNDPDVVNFFATSKISNARYKRQDYIDHVLVLSIVGDKKDIKAEAMREIYRHYATRDITSLGRHFSRFRKVLMKMQDINSYKPGLFKNKWSFVDAFALLLDNFSGLNGVDSEGFANLFSEFNEHRVEHRNEPEVALRSRKLGYGKEVYNYILAFEKEAAKKDNLKKRKEALATVFATLL